MAVTPYSAQLHMHGSFSEGRGSIDSHTDEAGRVGVDVLWWSDHDGFFTHFNFISNFGFENGDLSEPLYENEDWLPSRFGELSGSKWWAENINEMAASRVEVSGNQAYAGSSSLLLSGSSTKGQDEFQRLYYQFTSSSQRQRRTISAEVTLDLAILPVQVDSNARPIIDITLSRHSTPLADDVSHQLTYFLAPQPLPEPYLEDRRYFVPLGFTANQWNLYNLNITDDVRRGFKDLVFVPDDNSMHQVSIGVESRNGAQAAAYFDDLQIDNAVTGSVLFGAQQRILDSMQVFFPGIAQLQGVEISEEAHLNEFSITPSLPDYTVLREGWVDENDWITDLPAYQNFVNQWVVDQAHARGGLISYNHAFGASWEGTSGTTQERDQVLNDFLLNRLYGADILEVGYRARGGFDLATHLWLWDQLALNDLILTGTGVSDSHGMYADQWALTENNFVSWIFADAPEKADLIEGLRQGRVFFGDIIHFDGVMDLSTAQDFRMGQVILTDRDSAAVSVSIEGLQSGDEVRTIRNGNLQQQYTADGVTFKSEETFALNAQTPTFLRAEVYRDDTTEVVFSNPIYFLKRAPQDGLPPARAAIDIGNIVSNVLSGAIISNYFHRQEAGEKQLTLDTEADSATVVLTFPAPYLPHSVFFAGLTGSWAVNGRTIMFWDLNGSGSMRIDADSTGRTIQSDTPFGSSELAATLPREFALALNAPNPFNSTTIIRYQLPEKQQVSLRIYDLNGRLVKTLLNATQEVGFHSLLWDGRNSAGSQVASGIYIYRLQGAEKAVSRKMLLLE